MPASDGRYESRPTRGYRVRRQLRSSGEATPVTFGILPDPPAKPATIGNGIALIAFHGMGNHIEFQTLDQVAEGLLRVEEETNGTRPTPIVQSIRADDLVLRRLRLKLSRAGVERDVDLYEVYWAPFTEGEVVLRDVLSFLVRAGWNALLRFGRTFHRWLFGRMEPFKITQTTRTALLLALGVVVSLVFLNTAAGGLYALRFAGQAPAWVSPGLLKDLTTALAALAAMYLVFVALLGVGMRVRNRRRRDKPKAPPGSFAIPGWLSGVIKGAFFASAFATLAIAIIVLAFLIAHRLGPEEPSLVRWAPGWLGSTWTMLAVWGLLLAASYVIRRFLIQYVGDVVAYVYSFTLDRFFDIRKRIKDRGSETARAVYGLLDETAGELLYRKVLLLGHSLGSVIAYDTLNRLIDDDEAASANTALDVLGRTTMLLTFGSPLDKTAYLFRMQQQGTGEAREALAASVQPLIYEARFRPASFKWLNVFAPGGYDVIGASVDFYQNPGFPNPVVNVPDPDASIPVLAHIEHWDNKLIWISLHDRIMSC